MEYCRHMTTWRFIDTGPLDGPANMAVDEALLACFDPASSAPAFRLYGWSPPAFSLGRFQDADAVLDLDKCRAAGIPVVRRITGGGAIYHADEITYSLACAPHHIPAASSVKDSFRVLTAFLLRFYEKLGHSPRYAVDHYPSGTRLGVRTPLCFAGRESYDILVEGRKIGGNAQRRLKNIIFQHGSIPLRNCLCAAAPFVREPTHGIAEETTALSDFGGSISLEEIKGRLVEAFCETLASALIPGGLTADESALTGHSHLVTAKTQGRKETLNTRV
jgi:lipoyl(octanoyl) transferase